MGDLNFRLEMPNEQVRERIRRREWGLLLKSDQFLRMQRAGCVLSQFEEAPITFPPTYKYDPGTNRRAAKMHHAHDNISNTRARRMDALSPRFIRPMLRKHPFPVGRSLAGTTLQSSSGCLLGRTVSCGEIVPRVL